MTFVEESPIPRVEDYDLETIKRMEDWLSVYFKLDRKSRKLKSPLIEQIESGLGIIEIDRSAFKKNDTHTQLRRWISETCPKTVQAYLKLAIIQFARSLNVPIINPSFKVRLNY